jgi:hypothetical protein
MFLDKAFVGIGEFPINTPKTRCISKDQMIGFPMLRMTLFRDLELTQLGGHM